MFWLATEVYQLWKQTARARDTACSIRFPLRIHFLPDNWKSCSHRPGFCLCPFRSPLILSPHTFGDHRPLRFHWINYPHATKRYSLWPALHWTGLSMGAIVKGRTHTWNPNVHTSSLYKFTPLEPFKTKREICYNQTWQMQTCWATFNYVWHNNDA